jgi:hypothetical protein
MIKTGASKVYFNGKFLGTCDVEAIFANPGGPMICRPRPIDLIRWPWLEGVRVEIEGEDSLVVRVEGIELQGNIRIKDWNFTDDDLVEVVRRAVAQLRTGGQLQ